MISALYLPDYWQAIAIFKGKKLPTAVHESYGFWSRMDMDECGTWWCQRIFRQRFDSTAAVSKRGFFKFFLKRDDTKYLIGLPQIVNEAADSAGEKFWHCVKKELHLLMCTDDQKYRSLRRQLSPWTGPKSQLAYVSAMASGLAPHVGVATATVLTPLCAIGVLAGIRVGKEVLCARFSTSGPIGVALGPPLDRTEV